MHEYTIPFDIPASHPAYDDHFPGDPVVPGALLLSWLTEAAAKHRGNSTLKQVSSAKFLAPARPGDGCALTLTETEQGGRMRFVCARDEKPLLKGILEFAG